MWMSYMEAHRQHLSLLCIGACSKSIGELTPSHNDEVGIRNYLLLHAEAISS